MCSALICAFVQTPVDAINETKASRSSLVNCPEFRCSRQGTSPLFDVDFFFPLTQINCLLIVISSSYGFELQTLLCMLWSSLCNFERFVLTIFHLRAINRKKKEHVVFLIQYSFGEPNDPYSTCYIHFCMSGPAVIVFQCGNLENC